MKTATTIRRIALAIMIAIVINVETTWADCYSEQNRIMNRLELVMNQMNSGTAGYCVTARTIKREFPAIIEFYNRCPIVDPDGSMRNYIREMLDWAAQVEYSACAN